MELGQQKSQQKRQSSSHSSISISNLPSFSATNSCEAVDMEIEVLRKAGFSAWTFSSFKLQKLTRHPLAAAASVAVQDCACELGLSLQGLYTFFVNVESAYKNVPYHCSLHAADVVQAMHCLKAMLVDLIVFSPIESLALVIASVIHDVGHPVCLFPKTY